MTPDLTSIIQIKTNMSDLHILIKKSSATSTLRALANHDVECEYMVIPSANKNAALTELGIIGVNESIYSYTGIVESGEQTNGILLPKSAGK